MASPSDQVSDSNTTDVTPNTTTPNPSRAPQNVAQEPVQLTRTRFVVIFLSLMLCVFLFAVSCQCVWEFGPVIFTCALLGMSTQLDQLIVGMSRSFYDHVQHL